MATLLDSIIIGLGNFPFFAILFTLPILAATILQYRAINVVRIGIDYLFLMYFLCVIALVLFPLPTVEQAALLQTHRIQLIPFRFVADILRESPFDITNPATYLSAIFHETVLQVQFNILMTVPFGMYLSYVYGLNERKVVLLTLFLSVMIEVTQLTGIFGIYHGSYRLCDVDDLMANTFGGYVGFQIVQVIRNYLPELSKFNRYPSKALQKVQFVLEFSHNLR